MKLRDNLQDLDINGRLILQWEGINCITMAQDREEGQAFVNAVTKLHASQNSGNVMYS